MVREVRDLKKMKLGKIHLKELKKIECWDWSDIFTDDENESENELGNAASLGVALPKVDNKEDIKDYVNVEIRPPPKIESRLEITITHPHTTQWCNMPSLLQKKKLSDIWMGMRNIGGMNNIVKAEYVYEFHKSGHVHLHGYIDFEFNLKCISPVGLVSDYVKMVLLQMPKKSCNYVDKNMYINQDDDKMNIVYLCPQVMVRYINRNEWPERVIEWEGYIHKHQV